MATRPDVRRWIYGGLDVFAALIYVLCIVFLIPNRLPSGAIHLWALPVAMLVLGAGTLLGGPRGWKIAIAGGSVMLFVVALLLVRLIVSAAFLAGVYGSFGKAASMFTLVGAALIIEVCGLLPLVQVKFLMSRAGRRAFGA